MYRASTNDLPDFIHMLYEQYEAEGIEAYINVKTTHQVHLTFRRSILVGLHQFER